MNPFGWTKVSWEGHLVLLHDDEDQRRAGVAAWVRRGLQLGAKILYTEPPSEPSSRRVVNVLAEHDVDVTAAMERGQLEVVPADAHAYDPAWQAEVVEHALAAGHPSVRWSGEAGTAWGVMPPATHAAVEWTTDELCRAEPVSILCQYPVNQTQATLETVCAMHGAGVRESLLQTSPLPGGIALSGEVDASNERVLRSALRAAAAVPGTGTRSLVVDVEGLDFLDVAGARAFLTGTTAHRVSGGTVELRAVRGSVDRVFRELGVYREYGFTVEAA